MAEEILEKVVDLLEWYAPVEEGHQPDASTLLFAGGLDLDSVALLQLVTELESAFGCQIPAEAMTAENFRTVADVAALVSAKLDPDA